MSVGQLEVEWQFDAPQLQSVEDWLRTVSETTSFTLEREGVRNLVDTYYDTLDWRLLRAGYALRVRHTGARVDATLKSLASNSAGARQRTEVTEALPRLNGNASEPLDRLGNATGDVGTRVRDVIGSQSLRVLFSSRTMRRVYALRYKRGRAAEVALDETVIPASGTRHELLRVEVELDTASLEVVEPFVKNMRKACKLRLTTLTKFETGLKVHGLLREARAARRLDVGSIKVKGSMTLGELALVSLRKRVAMLFQLEPAARLGDDPEAVHKMRVATRSIRAALRLFVKVLPRPILALTKDVQWLGGLLGGVRDADVLLERVSAWDTRTHAAARQSLLSVLSDQRSAARRLLLEGFDSPRYARLRDSFLSYMRIPPAMPDAAQDIACEVTPRLIQRQYRKLRQLGATLTPASPLLEYHRLRIREKRLRYGLEFISNLHDKPVRRMLPRAAALQDLLGEMNDLHVAAAWLRALDGTDELRAQYEQLARSLEKKAARLLKQFPRVYKALKRERKTLQT